jgi:long-chain acyl-CoA synthetase
MTTQAVKASNRAIARAAANAADRFGDRVAVRWGHDGEWRDRTFAEVSEIVDEIALGLTQLGLEPGDRVGLLVNTRPEWTYSSLAISRAGGVVVPIYPTNSPDECEWVVGNSDAKIVICEDPGQAAKIEQVRDRLENLDHVLLIDPAGADSHGADAAEDGSAGKDGAGDSGDATIDELRERGRAGDRSELERRCEAVSPEDPYTIIYTSGTTGPPKGVVLSHGNCASVGVMVEEIGFVTDEDLSYLYLPLAHAFALTVQLASFDVGSGIVYFGGDPKQIVPELMQVKPTYVPSVPRIFEKIYSLALGMADDEQQLREAVKLGVKVRQMRRRGEDVPEALNAPFERAEEALYAKVRNLFGGRIDKAVSGAAPISSEILEFFYACGVPVLEGWGMTETTAVGTVNTLDNLKFGTVGRALPGVELKIADDGEILIKGPNVFREYWRNPDATRDTFTDDGWLQTGDLGSLDEHGYLSITGRKKDIIITAGGKNLTPSNIENDLKQSRWISQAVMYGDRRPYPVALITLDPEEIGPWAKDRGLPDDIPSLVESDEVKDLIQSELDRANAKYAQVEQVKKFALLDHDLTQEAGELTPTLKLKRNVVNERYEEVFEALYG